MARMHFMHVAMLAAMTLVAGSSRGPARAQDAPDPLCFPPPAPAPSWLPVTPAANETKVPDPRPASDCGFYRPAWQRFLIATQPSPDSPAFLSYPSFDQIFTPGSPPAAGVLNLTPSNIAKPNALPTKPALSDISQAGLRGVLIDQKGHPIYYAIHVDQNFLAFLRKNNLTTLAGLQQMNPNLAFPAGVMEFKSAWMIVPDKTSAPNYFVVPAKVPHYTIINGLVAPKIDPATKAPVLDNVSVALIALHVVFTLPGHPEMIWSTFEHIRTARWQGHSRQRAGRSGEPRENSTGDGHQQRYILSRLPGGNTGFDSQHAARSEGNAEHFDEATQSFTKGGTVLATSVYRPYPGSKSDGKLPDDSKEDDEVIQINAIMAKMFKDANTPASDPRQNYQLAGAVWINNPTDFKLNQPFSNPLKLPTDDPESVLAGEGRLGSTAMESFTEFEDTDGGFPKLFQLPRHQGSPARPAPGEQAAASSAAECQSRDVAVHRPAETRRQISVGETIATEETKHASAGTSSIRRGESRSGQDHRRLEHRKWCAGGPERRALARPSHGIPAPS